MDGMKLALIGLVVGLLGSLALSRLLTSLLFGLSPTDPVTYIFMVIFFALLSLVACWVPAHRASQVDPMEVLRIE